MIFNLNGLAAFAGTVVWTERNSPALEHTVPSEPEIVMQARRVVLLHAIWLAVSGRTEHLNLLHIFSLKSIIPLGRGEDDEAV
jgi:hypothetical protein